MVVINKFKEIPASKKSVANRSLVSGVGINDAMYITQSTINGKRSMCQFYRKWHNMLSRCYSPKFQENRPTYIGCSVCDEWLTFSNFKSWMEKQDWQGKQVDKDLLIQRNKVYSPETCLLVSTEINNLLGDCKASRGNYHQGVCWNKKTSKYESYCSVNGNRKYLGLFATAGLASAVYKKNQIRINKDCS